MAEIFHWAPASIGENTENFSEIITISESGYEKRRTKASRSLMTCTFNYVNRQRAERYAIAAFLRARSGPHEWFWLPSFLWDSSVKTLYTTGTTLYVEDNSHFSEARSNGRYFIYIVNSSGQYETAYIAATPGSDQLTLNAALTYDYPVGSEVDICYRARLADLNFAIDDLTYFVHNITLPFQEVK